MAVKLETEDQKDKATSSSIAGSLSEGQSLNPSREIIEAARPFEIIPGTSIPAIPHHILTTTSGICQTGPIGFSLN